MKNKTNIVLAVFAAVFGIFSFASSAQAQVILPTVACPAGYTCTVLPACPVGYTCTPAAQPASCPAGYVCTESTTTPGASAVVASNPSLELFYDGLEQTRLKASFYVTVTAGSQGSKVDPSYASISFLDQNNNRSQPSSYRSSVVLVPSSIYIPQNSDGAYVLGANQSAIFIASATVNTKEMFAGTYRASLSDFQGVRVNSNTTNSKTIVGEVSPYISSITGPTVSIGGTKLVQITGVRFTAANDTSKLYMDNVLVQSNLYVVRADGKQVTFFLPTSIANGFHTIYLKNSKGASNNVGFTVGTAVSASASVTDSSLALSYSTGQKENLLKASFIVTVDGGNSGVHIYETNPGVEFYSTTGTNTRVSSMMNSPVSVYGTSLNSTTDERGDKIFIVPAGQSAKFTVSATVDPRQLFAGTYYASLSHLYAATPGGQGDNKFPLWVEKNKTPNKTVVGEVSPYISGFGSTGPFVAGQGMTVVGQRLTSNVFIDNVLLTTGVKGDASNIGFMLPSNLTVGHHNIYVRDAATGDSNRVSFQIGSTPSTGNVVVTVRSAENILGIYGSTVSADAVVPVYAIRVSSDAPTQINSISIMSDTPGVSSKLSEFIIADGFNPSNIIAKSVRGPILNPNGTTQYDFELGNSTYIPTQGRTYVVYARTARGAIGSFRFGIGGIGYSSNQITVNGVGSWGETKTILPSVAVQPSLTFKMNPNASVLTSTIPEDNVVAATFDIDATGGDVNVSQLSVGRKGTASLESVSIYDGSTLLSKITSFPHSTPFGDYKWNSTNLSLVIPKGVKKTLTLRANITRGTTGSFSLGLVGVGYAQGQIMPKSTGMTDIWSRNITIVKDTTPVPVPPTPESQPVSILPWSGPASIHAGEPLKYTLNWQGGPLNKSWRAFIHVVKDDGSIVVANWFVPSPNTMNWSGSVSTTNTVATQPTHAPGTYRVMAGLYDPTTPAQTPSLVAGAGVTRDASYMVSTRYQVGTITIAAPVVTPPATTTPPVSESPSSVTASAMTTFEDHAGMWNVFAPGKGSGNYADGIKGGSEDWGWNVRLTLGSAKTVKSMKIVAEGTNQAWSTENSSSFPLVVFRNGSQLNASYGASLGAYNPGTYTLKMFGQIDNVNHSGSKLIVVFTDGTSVTTSMAPAGVKPPSVGGTETRDQFLQGANTGSFADILRTMFFR